MPIFQPLDVLVEIVKEDKEEKERPKDEIIIPESISTSSTININQNTNANTNVNNINFNNNTLWMILQLSDSAFPTGGFVHSGGLEAAAQCGMVKDRESICAFFQSQLIQAIHLFIPVVSVAYHYENMYNFSCIDQFCQAILANNVANRASKSQGIALLSTSANAFPWTNLATIKRHIISNSLHAHHATIFGLVYKELGIDLATTQQMYLFSCLRSFISSSVRLNLLGPIEAQNLQHRLSDSISSSLSSFLSKKAKNSNNTYTGAINSANTSVRAESVWNMDGKWEKLEEELEAVQTSPLLDLVQGMQDRLYSRMFNS